MLLLLSRLSSVQPHRWQPTRLCRPWDSPGKNPGVGCHFLLQGIFLIWGSNSGLLRYRQILYLLSHRGSHFDLNKIIYFATIKKKSLLQKDTSLVAQMVKHLPTMWETQVQSLGWEDPLEKEMATHSSTLAWRIPGMGEPDGLPSMGLHRVRHN